MAATTTKARCTGPGVSLGTLAGMSSPGPRLAALIVVALLTGSAFGQPSATAVTARSGPAVTAGPAAGSPPEIRHVLAISVDGLRPGAIRRLGEDRAPVFHRLIRHGVSTMNARTAVERTETLPNHAGMLTGRRVRASAGGHGVDINADPGGTVHDRAGEYVASVYSLVRRHGGRTALFTSKEKFALLRRSWPAAIDRYVYQSDNRELVSATRRDLLAHSRRFTFLHLSRPDAAGHAYGFGSAEYDEAVQTVDAELGRLLRTIRNHTPLRRRMVVLVTSDHGGHGTSHDEQWVAANYRVPFFAWGRGVPHGRNLYALNPGFRDPGNGRPRYDARRPPIRNAALANLASTVLGYDRKVPGSQINARRTLDIFGS